MLHDETKATYSQGSQHQSWHRTSMRVLLLEMIEKHPKANPERLVRLFLERAREDDDHLTAAVEYAVINTYQALERKKIGYRPEAAPRSPPASPSPEEKGRRARETEEQAEKIVAQIIRLNEIMPNGKRMRFCSGSEMIVMGNERTKEGAAWIKIGKKAGTKMVGQALNEEQVKAILR